MFKGILTKMGMVAGELPVMYYSKAEENEKAINERMKKHHDLVFTESTGKPDTSKELPI